MLVRLTRKFSLPLWYPRHLWAWIYYSLKDAMASARSLFCVGCIALSLLFATSLAAYASPTRERSAVLSTMSEAALSVIAQIRDSHDGPIQNCTWSATYSDRTWRLSVSGMVGGQPFSFTLSGTLDEDAEKDMVGRYTGNVTLADDVLHVVGASDWPYDRKAKDYRIMDFRQSIQVNKSPQRRWIVGSEILIGGTLGAGSAVATTTAATAGVSLGLVPWIAAGGAIAGTAALLSISNMFRPLNSSDGARPPALPERPSPKGSETLTPTKDRTYVAISRDGRIRASGPDGLNVLRGKYQDSEGSAQGTIGKL